MFEQVRELNPAPVLAHDRLVAEGRHRVRRQEAVRVALEVLRVALDELPAHQRREVVRERALEQAGLHELPAAGAVARQYRGQDPAERGLGGGVRLRSYGRERGAFAPDDPGEGLHPPRLGCDERRVGGVVRIRSGGTPGGDPAVDQRGVERRQRLVVDGHPRHFGGRGGDHHDVGSPEEREEALALLRLSGDGREVQRDAALATQPHRRGGLVPRGSRRRAARPSRRPRRSRRAPWWRARRRGRC